MSRIKPSELVQAQRFTERRPLSVPDDLSQIPGAMRCVLHRDIPDGSIDYYEADVGWLTQRGEPRVKPYRKYVWTPAGEKGIRLPSTSNILEDICPKPGVPVWAEARGIEGAVEAMKAGWIYKDSRGEDAVAIVREFGLGAEAAKDRAAKRGLNVHAINRHYMETEEAPVLSEHPAEHHGYLRGWVKATLTLKPQPTAVEQLVAHPEDGYAGRLDLRARVRRALETMDYKTQEAGRIYRSAHLQVNLYERGSVRCGDEPADRLRVVVLPASGDWNEEQHTMLADMPAWSVDAALSYRRACRPIDSACDAQNRAVRGREPEGIGR